jgi:F0F1-type ATP synthase assembly protein I
VPTLPPPPPTDPERKKSAWYLLAEYSSLAIMMPASAVVGYLIGAGLDDWLRTGRLFTIIFVVLGIGAGFLELVRVLARTSSQ